MDQVAQVREKTDIVALIAEYIPLKKAGRNFAANCPFHGEKTPSFMVSPERQRWHCFGCGKGGDAFTFLMDYEHLEFPEALRILAKRAGITLQLSHIETGISTKKEKIYSVNRLAAEYYHFVLTRHPAGKRALTYVTEERGIHAAVVETFLLGFAPVGNGLSTYLMRKKGYDKEDLFEAGLASLRGPRVVDFFQDRLMFPLLDHRDNVVGFSGRALSPDAMAKYINTRETLAYQKGSHFFGLSIAKDAIKKEDCTIIMEGEFDVMTAFQEGITNVVAAKGTALTENQAQLLSRFSKNIRLAMDQDKAGKEAIKRSLPTLEKKGLHVEVIVYDGKDPDEAIKKDPYAFKKSVRAEVGVYDYLLNEALAKSDPKTAEGKRDISEELLPYFVGIENEIVKEHYLRKLSTALSISLEGITKQAEKIAKKEKDATRIAVTAQKVATVKKSREEVLETYLLSLILQADDVAALLKSVQDVLCETPLTTASCQKIFTSLIDILTKQGSIDTGQFVTQLPPELLSAYDTFFLFPLPTLPEGSTYITEAVKVAKELKKLSLRKQITALARAIKEKDEDSIEYASLQEDYDRLVAKLKEE